MAKVRYKELPQNLKAMVAPSEQPSGRASIGMEERVGEFFFIKTDNLIPYRNQARSIFNEEELQGLATTIKEHGVRQPLSVIKSDLQPGKYEVISGERRLRASKIIGLERVPCIILRDVSEADAIALIENIQRADLHPIELGTAYKGLLGEAGKGTQNDLAQFLGVTQSHIAESIQFSELPDEIRTPLLERNIRSRDLLRRLAKLTDISEMFRLIDKKTPNSKLNSPVGQKKSLLRISVENGDFKIQKSALRNMDSSEKLKLKETLLKLIEEL